MPNPSSMRKHLAVFEAVAIIAATVIGAGVLGVPYVFSRGNFFSSAVVLALVAAGMALTMLFLGEVTLRTPGNHQISGYVERYLGRPAKYLQALIFTFGIYGALLAYTIGQGEVLAALFGGTEFFWTIAFYAVFSLLLYKGIAIIKHVEFALTLAIFAVLLVLGFALADNLSFSSIEGWGLADVLLSYGVILFACSGTLAVPQAREILGTVKKERSLWVALLVGALLPAALYFLFAFFVVGVMGEKTTPIATIGLGEMLGSTVLLTGSLFAFFAMATSFISAGLGLRDMYRYDFHVSYGRANWLVIAVPLLAYLAGWRDFIAVLGFVGAVGMGFGGLFIVWMYWSARRRGTRRPEFHIPNALAVPASFLLSAMYLLGVAASVL